MLASPSGCGSSDTSTGATPSPDGGLDADDAGDASADVALDASPDGSSDADAVILCTKGNTQCSGDEVQTCAADGSYHTTLTCPKGSVCRRGHCDDLRCPDETAASGGEFSLPLNAWPRYRHDNRNSGWTSAIVADKPALKFKVFVGGTDYDKQKGLASGPVVNQDGTIFIGAGELDGKGGDYYAFDAKGAPLFDFAASRKTGLSTPAVRKDGTSFVASGGNLLFAITPKGDKAWSYTTSAGTDGDPIVTREGTIIYPSEDGSVYAFDPAGTLVWQSPAASGPGHADSGIAESCDGRVYVGGVNGFFALDVKSGATLWKLPVTGMYQAVSSSPVLTADGIMFGVDGGGVGYAVDPAGKVLWSRALGPAGATSPTHLGTMLLVVLDDGKLHALDAATGTELWARPVGYALTRSVGKIAGPVVDGNMRIYVSSTDGNVYAFDALGNQLWKLPTSGVATPQIFSGGIAIADDGTMLVPGNDGYLYALQ